MRNVSRALQASTAMPSMLPCARNVLVVDWVNIGRLLVKDVLVLYAKTAQVDVIPIQKVVRVKNVPLEKPRRKVEEVARRGKTVAIRWVRVV